MSNARINLRIVAAALVAAVAMVSTVAPARADAQPDALGTVPRLKAAPLDEMRTRTLEWLSTVSADPLVADAAHTVWNIDAGPYATAGVLDRIAASVALVNPHAAELVALCAQPRTAKPLASQAFLADDRLPEFVRANLKLYYGRWLSQQRLYDESLEQLAEIDPADVCDPASLLFYQSVGYHRLLNKTDGLKSLGRLIDEVADSPTRYTTVAGLMREDLKSLDDESLDHIARRMDDVRRRLDLGRAGEKVRREEDGVIASLDKLIEEIEQQQQQQQQQSGGGSAPAPSQPMPDSRIAGASGEGKVEHKNIGKTAGWGDLPAKEREEALQHIGKDFPSHYRDVIEQYFRKLATESEDK